MPRNPFVDRMKVLGIPPGEFQAAKTQAENYLRGKDDQEEVPEADVRASINPSVGDRVWNEIKKDLGFVVVLLLLLSGCSGFRFEVQALSIKTGTNHAERVVAETLTAEKGKTKASPEIVDPRAF